MNARGLLRIYIVGYIKSNIGTDTWKHWSNYCMHLLMKVIKLTGIKTTWLSHI